MLTKRFIPEQIISKFRDVEVVLSQGKTTIDVFRPLNVGERTYCRWWNEYSGMGAELSSVRRSWRMRRRG